MSRGFTLFEVLIVLVLIAVVAGLALSLVPTKPRSSEARFAVDVVANALRQARSKAILENRESVLRIDAGRRALRLDSGVPSTIPGDAGISVYGARSEQIAHRILGIRFFPDGSSTGGQVTLRVGEAAYRVTVEWLTGRVEMAEASGL